MRDLPKGANLLLQARKTLLGELLERLLDVSVQIIFIVNFFWSMFFGPRAGRNPWNSNGLEWQAPSPPGHGNFDFQPVIYRGPYEYASPDVEDDYYPQTQPPKTE